ncbi:MAG: 50S ribosomal protein L23 [Planctomycetota bacterium]
MALDPIYIVKKPVLTEKTTAAMNDHGRYTFEVDRRATKTDIRGAIERLYGVNVVGIETRTSKGRLRRTRFGISQDSVRKTATVRLKDGEAMELF